jgi:hypothetical protein
MHETFTNPKWLKDTKFWVGINSFRRQFRGKLSEDMTKGRQLPYLNLLLLPLEILLAPCTKHPDSPTIDQLAGIAHKDP